MDWLLTFFATALISAAYGAFQSRRGANCIDAGAILAIVIVCISFGTTRTVVPSCAIGVVGFAAHVIGFYLMLRRTPAV